MTFDPGPLARLASHRDGDRWTLVLERSFRHPPETVWAALTDPEQLGAWAPYTADRNLGSPGEARLAMLDDEVAADLPAQVTRAESPTLLEYTWGGDVLRWELARSDDRGTRLTLRHTVADRTMLAKVAAGWHLCLVVAEHLLDGAPIRPIRGDDAHSYGWAELRDAYTQELDSARSRAEPESGRVGRDGSHP